jgi:putative FmdB family regulatory protein
MPIYEYKCNSCQHVCDILQKINDEPKTLCPECAKNSLVKLVSSTSFQLKGTGWYATDFKNPSSATKKADTSATSKTGE